MKLAPMFILTHKFTSHIVIRMLAMVARVTIKAMDTEATEDMVATTKRKRLDSPVMAKQKRQHKTRRRKTWKKHRK